MSDSTTLTSPDQLVLRLTNPNTSPVKSGAPYEQVNASVLQSATLRAPVPAGFLKPLARAASVKLSAKRTTIATIGGRFIAFLPWGPMAGSRSPSCRCGRVAGRAYPTTHRHDA